MNRYDRIAALVAVKFDTKKELQDYKREHDPAPGTRLQVRTPQEMQKRYKEKAARVVRIAGRIVADMGVDNPSTMGFELWTTSDKLPEQAAMDMLAKAGQKAEQLMKQGLAKVKQMTGIRVPVNDWRVILSAPSKFKTVMQCIVWVAEKLPENVLDAIEKVFGPIPHRKS